MLDVPAHISKDSIEITRGCKFNCHFCSAPFLVGQTIRKRPIKEIVEFIKKIKPKVKSFYFNDANIFSDPQHAKELFKALIPLKIKWKSHCTINIAHDDEALDLAKKSGCSFLAIGLETNNTKVSQDQGGKFLMQKKYGEYIKKIKKKKIKVITLFIFGFESDNFFSFLKLLFFSLKTRAFSLTLSHLTPLPGSQLYYNLIEQKKITNQNWQKYNLEHFVFNRKKTLNKKIIT